MTFFPVTFFLESECNQQQQFRKNVMKIYREVNKSNEVKSCITLVKTTSLQVKVFSQNSTLLHANYLK